MFGDYYLKLASWKGAPIRVHLLTPLGIWLFTGGFRLGAWLGFFFVILIHELGHAFVVNRVGAKALSIDVLPVGGVCHWQGNVSDIGRACIAWGGVWGQMLLFAVTFVFMQVVPLESAFARELTWSFTTRSAYLMAINLLPFPPLDGSQAWQLFPLLYSRFKNQRRKRIVKGQEADVLEQLRKLKEQDAGEIPEEAKGVVLDLFKKTESDSNYKN